MVNNLQASDHNISKTCVLILLVQKSPKTVFLYLGVILVSLGYEKIKKISYSSSPGTFSFTIPRLPEEVEVCK